MTEPLNIHGIHAADEVGISGMENWAQDRSNRLQPTVITVRQWFRMARASAWEKSTAMSDVSIYFRFENALCPWSERIDLVSLKDYQDLIDGVVPRKQLNPDHTRWRFLWGLAE